MMEKKQVRNSLEKLIKKKYEDSDKKFTFEEFKLICNAPYIHLNGALKESDRLPRVRLKGLGIFKPEIKTLKTMKRIYEEHIEKEEIENDPLKLRYFKRTINNIKNCLNLHQDGKY